MRVFFLAAIVAVAFANEECGEKAHFENCGTACPLTCENYKNPPKFCVLRCGFPCQCDKGYVKNVKGQCVRPEQCPSSGTEKCGENAHFDSCGNACPLTCDNHKNPPKICVDSCDIGCHCDEGYVKASDGQCVRPEQCPADLAAVEKNCIDKPESGLCEAYFPSWYFDSSTQKCHKFIYGGCGGNGNRYQTEKECLQNCQKKATSSICLQDKIVRSALKSYFYNKETDKCETFIYGGCAGNSNNFISENDCKLVCQA